MKSLQQTLSRIPTSERKARWEKMAAGGFSERELSEAYDRMSECLKKVDDSLRQSPWLAGKNYSLADIAMIPFIDRINNLRHDLLDTNRLPRLIDWYERMRKRPAFDKAFAFRDDPRAAEMPNL